MADTKYGKRFKQLRLQKGISLDMASSGITSKSSLYYWETGQRNMPFDKVVAMLKRMHIPYEELDTGLNDNYKYLSDIRIAYSTNNNKQLRQIAIDSLEQLQNNPKNKSSLIRAAISCNFLKDSTGELLFSPKKLSLS